MMQSIWCRIDDSETSPGPSPSSLPPQWGESPLEGEAQPFALDEATTSAFRAVAVAPFRAARLLFERAGIEVACFFAFGRAPRVDLGLGSLR